MTSDLTRGRALSRRGLLGAGAAALAGAAASTAGHALVTGSNDDPAEQTQVIPFHGPHQAGVETPGQTFAVFAAFDLRDGMDRPALARWMRLWTDDAERLTQGRPALADPDPELAAAPSRLTVTVGVGPGFLHAAGREPAAPEWLRPLPPFSVDALVPRWSGGDVLLQVCADDPSTVSHAVRMLTKDALAFAKPRWTQRGFRHPPDPASPTRTPRNLMGQLDGTSNPAPGSAEFARIVWIDDGPRWLRGGTSLVLRRIRIEAEAWDVVDRRGKEEAIGRRLADGAPLTGAHEHDEPDLDAANESGLTVIPPWSHIRRARAADPRQRIVRRSYNYDDGPGEESASDIGLLFASYQADVDTQFVPIQRRLDELDLLNDYTTPVGSAVFAILPGVRPGEWWGATLLS